MPFGLGTLKSEQWIKNDIRLGLESDTGKLKIARQYGCEAIVGDASEWAKSRDGLGVDLVVDASGASATLQIAMQLVRPNGQITKVNRMLIHRKVQADKIYL